jgi:hypothetical protein
MRPEIRRIIAVEAHRRRSGRCAVRIISLGTGEIFEIRPTDAGFLDVSSNLNASTSNGRILLTGVDAPIDLQLNEDVTFDGYDHSSKEPFTGRAGGGVSVTLYDHGGTDFYQYVVAVEGDPN